MDTMTDAEATKNVAERIVRLLAERGMTQRQLADQAQQNEQYISRVCRGKLQPTVGPLTRIADALHISIDELVGHSIKKSRQSA